MKTKIVKTLALILAAVLMLSLTACGGEAPKETAAPTAASSNGGNVSSTTADGSKRIVVQYMSDPGSYAIFDAGSSVRAAVQYIFYENLFGDYEGGELTPLIASGYEKVSDGVYDVTIRDDVYDANGNHITVDDVVWCFNTAIEGGKRNSTFGNVKEVKKLDDHTVEFVFGEEFVSEWLYAAGRQGIPIVSRASYEKSESGFASDPVGTGPYKIKSWVQGSHIIFEKNENYWDKENMAARQPYDEIEYRFISEPTQVALALETGEVDIALGISNQDVPKFTEDKGFHQVEMIDVLTRAIIFNCDESNPFSNLKLRQAVCYAIDSEAIITTVSNGMGAPCHALIAANDNSSFTDYNMEWNDEPYYDYNPELAKQLMVEAGYPDGLKVKLMTKDTPEYRTTCEIMQAYLGEIGIEVEILAYENALYQTYRYDPTAFDLYLGQIGGTASVVQPWKWYCTPDQARNGKTVYMMDGAEFWPIFSAAAHESTHSAETVEAAWDWMKENVPMYGYGFVYKYLVYNDDVNPYISSRGEYLPWLDGTKK